VPPVAAGGRGGVVLDGRAVGSESGWSRRENERDIERDLTFLKLKTEAG